MGVVKVISAHERILGTLYGQAIGDAVGMPTELWPRPRIQCEFPDGVTTFMAGPKTNAVAKYYQRGAFTDDTSQALAILDSLMTTNWQPDEADLVRHVLAWAESADAWERNILGPSSKAALLAVTNGENPQPVTDVALTNGAAMRVAPLGTLFKPDQLTALVDFVAQVTRITHSSDVAIGGACIVAGAVTAAMVDADWDTMMTFALRAGDAGTQLGAATWSARLRARVELGLALTQRFRYDPERFSQSVYELLGTGTMIAESVPAAISIAYYTRDVKTCALMCANLGGDTDTIGAMATAICGAKTGIRAIDPAWQRVIDEQNAQHDLRVYAAQMARVISN